MAALHVRTADADVLLLNELGLGPGIDHLSALDLLTRLKARGQVVEAFTSFCGGVPAPDVPHTPLRYKLSWNAACCWRGSMARDICWVVRCVGNVSALRGALEWLGLVPPSTSPAYTTATTFAPAPPTHPALPARPTAPINIFTSLLAHKLAYARGERDMVVLAHEVVARDSATQVERVYTSALVECGTPRASAMARTVGVPVGVAALLVLDGEVGVRGVCGPVVQGVYEPVLRRLERYGLGMKETVREVGVGRRTVESALRGVSEL
ncbi:hypothetical protein C0993_003998 [Termitomyces sp. T159_Od127]|nr:hypothetical protein C0993_003998 [Termitomyces sp. T159_Od127]